MSPSSPLPASFALVATIATIEAASKEREHVASLALAQERAMGAALTAQMERAMGASLTAQMAIAERLLLGRPPVAHEDPSVAPETPHASGLDADTIAALHSQAAGVHDIWSLVSVMLDQASSHYPRW